MLPAGREVGDYLIRHPGIDKISFTGSTAAGKHIAGVAAERLARVSLELGGKSAAMILDDADIDHVLKSLVPYSMPITGQVCFSLTRVLVSKKRKAEFVDAYTSAVSKVKVGDPFEADTGMGPLTMQRQLDRVLGYIEKGKNEGAKLALGGGRPAGLNRGFFVEPTVFTDVDPGMTIFKEEIFGPVVSVIDYDNEADMIAKANDTTYGLHGAVYTQDPERGFGVAREYRAGSIAINGMAVDIHMPFGGFKQSGIGRDGGIEGLENYTETKAVYFHPTAADRTQGKGPGLPNSGPFVAAGPCQHAAAQCLSSQPLPADPDAADRRDQPDDREDPEQDVPQRPVECQRVQIPFVEQVVEPAIGAAAAIDAVQYLAGRRVEIEP